MTIGEDCKFNEGPTVQGHSMEDGTFQSDCVVIGDRCSDNARFDPAADALLMEGEDVAEGTTYVGTRSPT